MGISPQRMFSEDAVVPGRSFRRICQSPDFITCCLGEFLTTKDSKDAKMKSLFRVFRVFCGCLKTNNEHCRIVRVVRLSDFPGICPRRPLRISGRRGESCCLVAKQRSNFRASGEGSFRAPEIYPRLFEWSIQAMPDGSKESVNDDVPNCSISRRIGLPWGFAKCDCSGNYLESPGRRQPRSLRRHLSASGSSAWLQRGEPRNGVDSAPDDQVGRQGRR